MDGVMSKERLLCAYMADRDGIVKLRMPFDEEQLEALMDQETLPELIVFLDSHVTPVLVVRGENIQFCTEDGLVQIFGIILCLAHAVFAGIQEKKREAGTSS